MFENGTVLPSGLLGSSGAQDAVTAFNRSYRNTGLKAGIVVKSYAASDSGNQNGLCTEYDVEVMEQFENKGSTSILYRNCISIQGFGSKADYLEFTLRPKTVQTNKGFLTFGDQDGAIVLLQCLDNIGDKAVVVGNLIHPDRPTTITTTDPHLQGEYNGVQIVVNSDGSTALNFQGATNSQGQLISNPGLTSINISADGSFQVMHSTITFSLAKSGTVTLTANQDVDINAQGKINFIVQGDATINTQGKCNITSSGKTTIKASEIDLNGSTGMILTTATDPVVDNITGVPTMGVVTVKSG